MTHTPTPGPWRFHEVRQDFGKGEQLVDYSITGSHNGRHVLPILAMTHNWPQNALPNAHLIAAAPDMLAALRAVVGDADPLMGAEFVILESTLDNVRAAIEKAESQS